MQNKDSILTAVYKIDTIPNNDKAFYVFLCHLSTSYKA
jgi:hypothetical protein